jgi:hypothetical protein
MSYKTKTNYLLETFTILALAAIFVFSYPKTAEASHHERHPASTHHFNIEDAMNNKEIVLMAIGTAVYYREYCAGLTNIGMSYLDKAIAQHKINVYTMSKEAQYKVGYKLAESYPTCGKLRFAISDAGLGAMIR